MQTLFELRLHRRGFEQQQQQYRATGSALQHATGVAGSMSVQQLQQQPHVGSGWARRGGGNALESTPVLFSQASPAPQQHHTAAAQSQATALAYGHPTAPGHSIYKKQPKVSTTGFMPLSGQVTASSMAAAQTREQQHAMQQQQLQQQQQQQMLQQQQQKQSAPRKTSVASMQGLMALHEDEKADFMAELDSAVRSGDVAFVARANAPNNITVASSSGSVDTRPPLDRQLSVPYPYPPQTPATHSHPAAAGQPTPIHAQGQPPPSLSSYYKASGGTPFKRNAAVAASPHIKVKPLPRPGSLAALLASPRTDIRLTPAAAAAAATAAAEAARAASVAKDANAARAPKTSVVTADLSIAPQSDGSTKTAAVTDLRQSPQQQQQSRLQQRHGAAAKTSVVSAMMPLSRPVASTESDVDTRARVAFESASKSPVTRGVSPASQRKSPATRALSPAAVNTGRSPVTRISATATNDRVVRSRRGLYQDSEESIANDMDGNYNAEVQDVSQVQQVKPPSLTKGKHPRVSAID